MTYKAWRAQREQAGLSAEGGIAPQSGANATAHLDNNSTPPETPIDSASYLPPQSSSPLPDRTEPVDTAIEPIPDPSSLPTSSTEIQSEKGIVENSVEPVYEINASSKLRPAIATSSKHRDSSFSADADDEDDHSPIPNELLATSGDNCAICIEPLEDDDEVRGLTCGHCYHQTCLDPWLTQRRASCPLCKADYYVPKPPSDPTTTTTTENGNTTTTTTTPAVTTEHWAPIFFRPFNRPIGSVSDEGPRYPPPFTRFDRRATIPEEPTELSPTTTDTAATSANNRPGSARRSARRVQIPNPFRRTRRANTDVSALERGEGHQNEEQQNEGQSS
jgi:Ring finger domain